MRNVKILKKAQKINITNLLTFITANLPICFSYSYNRQNLGTRLHLHSSLKCSQRVLPFLPSPLFPFYKSFSLQQSRTQTFYGQAARVNRFLLDTRGIGISFVSGSLLHVSLNTHSKMYKGMIEFWAQCRYREKSCILSNLFLETLQEMIHDDRLKLQ